MINYYKISIIMVSYNQGEFIKEALQSIEKQKYPNLELIIVDGGSDDDTIDIISEFRDLISIFISERDYGMYHARNKGVFLSTGEIVGFLNTDDRLKLNALQVINKTFCDNNQLSMVYGITLGINNLGEIMDRFVMGNFELQTKNYFHKMPTIPDQSTFYRKEVFTRVGVYDTILNFGADTDLKCRIIKKGLNILNIDDVIAYWRIHDSSLTVREDLKWKRLKEAILVNKRYSRRYLTYYNVRILLRTIFPINRIQNFRRKLISW